MLEASRIDEKALFALVAFHLHTISEEAHRLDFEQMPAVAANTLVAVGCGSGYDSAHGYGVELGLRLAAIVLSNPLLPNAAALRQAIKVAKDDYQHVMDDRAEEREQLAGSVN